MIFDSNEIRDLRYHCMFMRDQYQRYIDAIEQHFGEQEELIDELKLCLLREAQRAEATYAKDIPEPEFEDGKLVVPSSEPSALIVPTKPDPQFGIWVYGAGTVKRKL